MPLRIPEEMYVVKLCRDRDFFVDIVLTSEVTVVITLVQVSDVVTQTTNIHC
jgi:hypothetical protein